MWLKGPNPIKKKRIKKENKNLRFITNIKNKSSTQSQENNNNITIVITKKEIISQRMRMKLIWKMKNKSILRENSNRHMQNIFTEIGSTKKIKFLLLKILKSQKCLKSSCNYLMKLHITKIKLKLMKK